MLYMVALYYLLTFFESVLPTRMNTKKSENTKNVILPPKLSLGHHSHPPCPTARALWNFVTFGIQPWNRYGHTAIGNRTQDESNEHYESRILLPRLYCLMPTITGGLCEVGKWDVVGVGVP